MSRRWWGGAVVVVLLVAALLRLYRLPELPPALSFDEAGNGVAARDILEGRPQLFWRIGGGKEPLWPYLVAVPTAVLGPSPLALRGPAAMVGVATVGAVMALAASWRWGLRVWPGRILALSAGLAIATSYWHVHLSRLGLRAILLPLVSALALGLFWRAINSGREGHFALAGLALALSQYTYLAARLLPPLLVGYLVLDVALARFGGRRPLLVVHGRGLLAGGLCFALGASPLAAYFILHPDALIDRAGVVSIFNPEWHGGDITGTFARALALTLASFSGGAGDANLLVNLPGKPIAGPLLGAMFWLGFAAALWRWREPAALFVPCWWLVMLLPSLLAPEGIPHHLRLVGAMVPTYMLQGLGLSQAVSGAGKLIGRWRRLRGAPPAVVQGAAVVLLFVLFAGVGLQTYRDYFERWALQPGLGVRFDDYTLELVQRMEAEADPATLYIYPMDLRAGHEARHYTIDYLAGSDAPYTWLVVDEPLLAARLTEAAAGRTTLQVVNWLATKHAAADERQVLRYLLESEGERIAIEDRPSYRLETWRLPGPQTVFQLPPIEEPVGAFFGERLKLEARHLTGSEGKVFVALRWAPVAKMTVDYKASLRLRTLEGELVGQVDRTLRHNWHQGTSLWPPETVNEYYFFGDVPPGRYRVEVVVYHPETLEPLAVGESGELPLGEVAVP